MKNNNIFYVLLLTFGTMIWGSAFIFQDIGMDYVEPLTFNVFRCLACTIFLIMVSLILSIFNKKKKVEKKYNNKDLIIGGIIVGILTGIAMATQQIGISYDGAGRSGFITSLYIIFVPLIGLLFGRKLKPIVMIAIVFSITGLYLINVNGVNFSFSKGTFWLLACALFYALQIIGIGVFTTRCDSIKLTAIQFFIAGLVEVPFMFIFEDLDMKAVYDALIPILYCGILSSGVAFTIQIYTQKFIEPTIASMIMALESVFSIIFASLILKEKYSIPEIFGCICIFISVIITQLPKRKEAKIN